MVLITSFAAACLNILFVNTNGISSSTKYIIVKTVQVTVVLHVSDMPIIDKKKEELESNLHITVTISLQYIGIDDLDLSIL